MHSKTFLSKLIFLTLFVLLLGVSPQAATRVKKEKVTFLSHTYTHELLKNVRTIQPKISTLASKDNQFKAFSTIAGVCLPITINNRDSSFIIGVMSPYCATQIGFDRFIDGLMHSFGAKVSTENISLLNLVIGNLYRSSWYGRLAYSYVPLGRHISNLFVPHDMLTRRALKDKAIILELGTSGRGFGYQWNTEISAFSDGNNGSQAVVKSQYTKERFSARSSIERYTLGGGLGSTVDKLNTMVNFYADVDFTSHFNTSFEILYKNTLTLHIEGAKHFTKMPFTDWNMPWVFVSGFAKSGLHKTQNPINNIFSGVQVKLWKQRIILALGGEWDIVKNELEPIWRLGISL